MGERTDVLVSTLRHQSARAWDAWEAIARCFPEDEWATGDVDYFVPARMVMHVVVCADAFSGDIPFDQYDKLKWFGVDEWETPPEGLPDKGVVLAKLAEVRALEAERLAELADADLVEPEKAHSFAGRTRMDKWIFALMHSFHHLGELNAERMRRGIEPLQV